MEMNDFGFAPEDMGMDFSAPEEINQVPHSREAEEAVLGAVLINPEKYFDVSQLINGKDFYIHRNRWVWEAYGALFEKGQAIDVQTVCEELYDLARIQQAPLDPDSMTKFVARTNKILGLLAE